MNVCIIPARGGSKRIPRKNIKLFHGKPMIAWSIETAIKSGCFDRIICSTDDEEIAAVARKYGAYTPFLRPKELSNDYVGTTSVIAHAIDYLQKKSIMPDLVCCVYATAPFMLPNDIKKSLELIKREESDYCFSVTSYPFPIQRSIRITKERRCDIFQPEMFNKRSQDLEDAYHDAGQFYWGRPFAWSERKVIFSKDSTPYILPRYRVQDIDTLEDWSMAELMFHSLKEKKEYND
jgi:pseudaminic acid cytidylyltransferase